MFWTKVAQFGPPGTPQKSAFFQESGRKRMKEWHQVTFTKEWMNALDDTRILAPTHFQNLVSFPRYGRLKKKCWYKLICNGTYWLLLTGHFGLVFIRPSQWSITAVLQLSQSFIDLVWICHGEVCGQDKWKPLKILFRVSAYSPDILAIYICRYPKILDLPSKRDIWSANWPLIYLEKSSISSGQVLGTWDKT